VAAKPHDAVVKFYTCRNLQRNRAVLPAIARLSCFVCQACRLTVLFCLANKDRRNSKGRRAHTYAICPYIDMYVDIPIGINSFLLLFIATAVLFHLSAAGDVFVIRTLGDVPSGVAKWGEGSVGPPMAEIMRGGIMGMKFDKLEFLKLLSHVLNIALLIFVFKEKGTLSTALLL